MLALLRDASMPPCLLRQSLIDTYTRTRPKGNREYPCKKKRKPPGPPNIQEATKQQRDHAKRLKKKKKPLTA